ncbi:MAG: hypothetical protein ACR5K2_03380 [Wolbachia sp.]
MIEEINEYSFRVGMQEIKLSLEELRILAVCRTYFLYHRKKRKWIKLDKTVQLEIIKKLIRNLVDSKTNLDSHNEDGRPFYTLQFRRVMPKLQNSW